MCYPTFKMGDIKCRTLYYKVAPEWHWVRFIYTVIILFYLLNRNEMFELKVWWEFIQVFCTWRSDLSEHELSKDLAIVNYCWYLLTHVESYYKVTPDTIVLFLIPHQQGDDEWCCGYKINIEEKWGSSQTIFTQDWYFYMIRVMWVIECC
jgi:hypothetical protein